MDVVAPNVGATAAVFVPPNPKAEGAEVAPKAEGAEVAPKAEVAPNAGAADVVVVPNPPKVGALLVVDPNVGAALL